LCARLVNGRCELPYGAAAFVRRPGCHKFGICSGSRDAHRADANSRALERVRKRGNRSWIALAHSFHQEFSLTVEKLQDFSLKTAIAKCHPQKVTAIKDRSLQRIARRLNSNFDGGLRHLGLPLVFLLSWSLT
jgi:hypothetical protein